MSCSRRYSVCQVSANRIRKIVEAGNAADGREGVMGVHSAGEVWYLRLPCYRLDRVLKRKLFKPLGKLTQVFTGRVFFVLPIPTKSNQPAFKDLNMLFTKSYQNRLIYVEIWRVFRDTLLTTDRTDDYRPMARSSHVELGNRKESFVDELHWGALFHCGSFIAVCDLFICNTVHQHHTFKRQLHRKRNLLSAHLPTNKTVDADRRTLCLLSAICRLLMPFCNTCIKNNTDIIKRTFKTTLMRSDRAALCIVCTKLVCG